jgi:periplasmic copper chaperone A
MKLAHPILVALMMATLPTAHAAPPQGAPTGAQAPADAHQIEHVMKAQFDKPEAPLQVAPVTVEGGFALAGWIQGDKGGRAFLRKADGKWSIAVCGGDGLKDAKNLVSAGMPPATASRLVKRTQEAEKKLPAERVKMFALFDGMLKIDPAAQGPHGPHGAHQGGHSH